MDSSEAKNYLQEHGIELGMDHRTAKQVAELHLRTGSTAVSDEVEGGIMGDRDPVKVEFLPRQAGSTAISGELTPAKLSQVDL